MGKLTDFAGSRDRWKNLVKQIAKTTKDELRATFNVRNTMATLAVLLLTSVGVAAATDKMGTTELVYRVYIDGQYHGVVRDKALILDTMAAFGDKLKATVAFEPVNQAVVTTSEATVAYAIEESTRTIVDMVAVRVNNRDVVYVKDVKTAEALVEKIKSQFVKPEANATVTLAEQVDFVPVQADKAKISSADAAYSLLVQGKNEKKTYVVSRGDSLWTIAAKNAVTVEELQSANPNIANVDEIKEGQSLNLTKYEPMLNVQAVYEESREITTSYEVEYREDEDLAKGKEEVLQEGAEGKKTQQVRVTRKNGTVEKEEVLSEVVISEPQKEIIAKGTKVEAAVFYSSSPTGSATASGDWAWPIGGGYVSSVYGENRGGKPHLGLDIAAPTGTPVYASNSGTVIQAGDAGDGYGTTVIISHGGGVQTVYAHLSSMSVSVGQSVNKGQKVGGVGSTGWSTGAHLHYEARVNGSKVNPSPFM